MNGIKADTNPAVRALEQMLGAVKRGEIDHVVVIGITGAGAHQVTSAGAGKARPEAVVGSIELAKGLITQKVLNQTNGPQRIVPARMAEMPMQAK